MVRDAIAQLIEFVDEGEGLPSICVNVPISWVGAKWVMWKYLRQQLIGVTFIQDAKDCWPEAECHPGNNLIGTWRRSARNGNPTRTPGIANFVDLAAGIWFYLSPDVVVPVDAAVSATAIKVGHCSMYFVSKCNLKVGQQGTHAGSDLPIPHVQPNGFVNACVKVASIAIEPRFGDDLLESVGNYWAHLLLYLKSGVAVKSTVKR